MIQSFSMSDVSVADAYFQNAFQKEKEYLMSFDCDKLLSCFRKTRGLTPKAENYEGWENTEIRGHTMGHYLTALSQTYATTQDNTIRARLQYMMDELSLCQFESGYLSAFPEEFFDRVENRKPVWVPWYTMHKIIAGLVSVYQLTKIEEALQVVSKLGDWVYNRTEKWTPEIHANVLSVEYGGMNDCMYELYKITGSEKHAAAAHQFDETELFHKIHDGEDVLNNRHANTTIPKFTGALNRYLALGEQEAFYLETCERFWDIVVHHHSYVTGGNSESEHFGKADILDAERTDQNCETCNTYNMLKMSRELFQVTGEKKYADFYENTLLNGILPSQNPDTGMTMYFQPMATGYFKVFNRPFQDFWCCTGTGMENFSKLNDSLYFYEKDRLYVNLYLPSAVDWHEKGLRLEQKTDIPNSNDSVFTIRSQGDTDFTLCLRIPEWAKDTKVQVNGIAVTVQQENGYIFLKRIWKNGDTVRIIFAITVGFSALPDNKNSIAFTYGPLVLCAGLGNEKMEESNTGILVRVASKHVNIKDYLLIQGQSIEEWKNNISNHLVKTEGKLEFRLKGTDEDDSLVFTPYYRQHTQRYGVYWILVEEGSAELQKYLTEKRRDEAEKAAEIDRIPIGNDQYELSHHVMGKETESGDREGYHFRFAKPNGWFSYEMACSPDDTDLQINYIGAGCKDGFDIYANDVLLSHEVIGNIPWKQLVSKTYHLPGNLTAGKSTVTVKFVASAQQPTAWIVDVMRTAKKIPTVTE